MIIIGGLGSILGASSAPPSSRAADLPQPGAAAARHPDVDRDDSHLESMIFGALIVFFLIVEPHGLARLWAIAQGEIAAVAVPALTAPC